MSQIPVLSRDATYVFSDSRGQKYNNTENKAENEVLGNFLQPPHKHLTSTVV